MYKTYFCLFVIHFSLVILIGKILYLILPCHITNYYFQAANFLLCVLIAKWTLGCSKKLLLNEKVKPKEKAILITGCARGIGKSVAKHLDSKGFHVFATCRNADSPGADELRKSCSSRLKVFEMDVTNDESVEKAVKFVKANLGTNALWAIVNNAGIQKGFFTELTCIQDFQDTIEANTIGQVRVTKAFLPLLRECRGRVVNMGSIAGRITAPMCGPYTISKFGCNGFSDCLRQELSLWGMPVISIEPEFFETELVNGECLTRRADEAFASVSEEIRKDYGEEFHRNFKNCVLKMFPPSLNIHRVLEDIESAVSLRHPDVVYKTSRNILFTMFYNFYESSPVEIRGLLAITYLRVLGLTTPEMAKKANKDYEYY